MSDVGGKNSSEIEAIKAINRAKGFAPLRDSAGETTRDIPVSSVSDSGAEPSPQLSQSSDSSSSLPIPRPPVFFDDGQITISQDLLKNMVHSRAETLSADAQKQVEELTKKLSEIEREKDSLVERLEAEKDEAEKRILEERRQRETLARTFVDFGFTPDGAAYSAPVSNTVPYIAPLSTRGGVSARDALKEYQRILTDDSATHSRSVINPMTGYESIQRNLRYADQWMLKHRDEIREGIDAALRKAGIFRGSVSGFTGKDAPTTFANFPVIAREYLSAIVRLEHSASFVLWQFVNRTIANGVPVGQTALVPRVRHLETGSSASDWRLTPGTPLTIDRQSLSGNNIAVPIQEWGMGLDKGNGVPTIRPVGLADMVTRTSIIDLEQLLQDRIGYNYHTWEDTLIFEILLSTTRVVYSQSGAVVATPAEVLAGGGGQLSLSFLSALRAQMANDRVPPLPDGSYIYVGPPDHIAQLEADIRSHHNYVDPGNTEALLNMLSAKTRNEYAGRISGYRFKACGFQIFEGCSFSVGLPGSPGVQTETLGGVSTTTRSGFAMGADAIGMAVSLPMELRENFVDDFQRMRSIIWKEESGATGLDIDPSRVLLPYEVARPVGAEEQLRVYEVRTSTKPV